VYFDYHEQQRTTVKSRIRIMKRGAGGNTNGVSANEKTVQQREREMASAVKSSIAEREARNRALKTAASSLIRFLENSRLGPVTQFV
jgi:hypothetical protein